LACFFKNYKLSSFENNKKFLSRQLNSLRVELFHPTIPQVDMACTTTRRIVQAEEQGARLLVTSGAAKSGFYDRTANIIV